MTITVNDFGRLLNVESVIAVREVEYEHAVVPASSKKPLHSANTYDTQTDLLGRTSMNRE